MPVFFLVSGMLASSAVHRPWSKSGNRTLGMVYLYLVWMLLFFGFITVFGSAPSDPVRFDPVRQVRLLRTSTRWRCSS